jgi:hypothetical protein
MVLVVAAGRVLGAAPLAAERCLLCDDRERRCAPGTSMGVVLDAAGGLLGGTTADFAGFLHCGKVWQTLQKPPRKFVCA